MIKHLWNYSNKFKYVIFTMPLIVAAEVFVELIIPYFMGNMMDKGALAGDMKYLVKMSIYMVVAALLLAAIGLLENWLTASWSTEIVTEMRDGLFYRIESLPQADIEDIGTSTILTRLTADTNNIKRALGTYNSILRCPITVLGTVIVVLYIYPKTARIFAIAAAAFTVVIVIVIKLSIGYYEKMYSSIDDINLILGEDINGIQTVKAFGQEGHETGRFIQRSDRLRKFSSKAYKATAINEPVLIFIMNACIMLLIVMGGNEIIEGKMQAGILFCLISYTTQILMQLYSVALIIVPIISAIVCMRRIFEIIDRKESFSDAKDSELVPADGSLEFKNVYLRFGGEDQLPVLRDINLRIKSGENIGLIGAAGSGKSVLSRLIPRIYECSEGDVFVGGENVRGFSYHKLRSTIGVVPQNSLLFSGTVLENLLWGREDATTDEVAEACRIADALDFIMAFPDKYDTYIGQGGSTVSGGQRQRLCLARALIRKPRILVIDGGLSAVDNATMNKILDGLKEYCSDMTVIMISQRLSTMRDADRIVVMSEGIIDAAGTHDELMACSKVYRDFYETQNMGV